MSQAEWDELYSSEEQLFTGSPNGALVAEVSDLNPGRALDVGCGEGADAIWLARRGWQVASVDISQVAIDRAHRADSGNLVTWTRGDLIGTPPASRAFDLVSAQYFPLPHQDDHAALTGLLDAVAPGGTLLVVSHYLDDLVHHGMHMFDPADYYQPTEIAQLLDDSWTVVTQEVRPRSSTTPEERRHVRDDVLVARRAV
ncbi:class I SAM-dependent methyltransferase [Leekyejoonella antrihumi]|uniref:Class I SAM-dependent methyltransferase n=1 Tax=Leekyejoonella antrihumi TaxID=1660198 RepID=A0A563E942_9MICO|nr:class I SAM-dependent methyltransferase [Leekyejoonella antrihumi]TWP38965.1 class I SAM-dependent methyltransferase [Leekyejoonella antrihumi]